MIATAIYRHGISGKNHIRGAAYLRASGTSATVYIDEACPLFHCHISISCYRSCVTCTVQLVDMRMIRPFCCLSNPLIDTAAYGNMRITQYRFPIGTAENLFICTGI